MNKRSFLKILGLAGTSALVMSGLGASEKKASEDANEWHNDPENKHTPVVKSSRDGDIAHLELDVSKHPQTAEHYIDKVEVYDENKKLLFSATVLPVTGVSQTVCRLKLAAGTKVFAVSHCNKHGNYFREVTL